MEPIRERGFSLLEVVITVAILTTISLSSVLVAIPISRQTRLNRELENANLEIRKVLEEVHAAPFDLVTTRYPPDAQLPVSCLKAGKLSVTYVDPTADPLRVQIVLSWDSPEVGPVSRTFATCRTN